MANRVVALNTALTVKRDATFAHFAAKLVERLRTVEGLAGRSTVALGLGFVEVLGELLVHLGEAADTPGICRGCVSVDAQEHLRRLIVGPCVCRGLGGRVLEHGLRETILEGLHEVAWDFLDEAAGPLAAVTPGPPVPERLFAEFYCHGLAAIVRDSRGALCPDMIRRTVIEALVEELGNRCICTPHRGGSC